MTCNIILRKEIIGGFLVDNRYKMKKVVMHKHISLPYPPFIGLNIEFGNKEEPDFKIESITFSMKRWVHVCSQCQYVAVQDDSSALDEVVSNLHKYDWVTDSDSLNDENIS